MVKNELYHYGIRGQKWGRRRFQNKDGTLTPAGKKRYDNEYTRLREEKKVLTNKKKTAAKIQKLDDMKKANDDLRKELEGPAPTKKGGKSSPEAEKPKGISDLSTEELRARTDRMRAERDYISAQMELSRLQPEKKSAGRKFAEKVLKEQIVPAAVDIGKKNAEKYLKKKLGLDDSQADALKKESERLKREADDWTNKMRTDKAKEYFNSKPKKDDEPEKYVFTGKDVVGEGTSRRKEKTGPIYDADYRDFTSSPYTNTGKNYVQLLLEDKQMKHSDESSNELYHYKYIRREWDFNKKKYKYYYKDQKPNPKLPVVEKIKLNTKDVIGFDEEKAYNTMKNTVDYHKSGVDMFEEEIDNIKKGKNGWDKYSYKDSMIKRLEEDRDWEKGNLNEANKTLNKALKEYEKTPLYKIRNIEKKIQNGKKAVKNFIKKFID